MLRAGSEKGRDVAKHIDQDSLDVTNSAFSGSGIPEPDGLSVIALQVLMITRYHRCHIPGG